MKGLHVLFDGNNTSYRANCTTELYTKTGERTSALLGVLNITHSTIQNLAELYDCPVKEVIYAWDLGHSPRRKEVFPEYKANRNKEKSEEDKLWMSEFVAQANILHENLPLFGIKSFRKKQWEGDDLIYGLSENLKDRYPDDIVVIISTDEDFHQLVSENVNIFSPIKQILYTKENYKSLTGIAPELFLTYKILKGDSSDGIPGISGIGEKTGKSLVNTYGDLGNLLSPRSKIELMKSKRTSKIFTQEGLGILSRNNKLINLKDYVDLTPIQADILDILDEEPFVDTRKAKEFLMKYQLTSLLVKFKTWIEEFEFVVENFDEQ